MTLFRLRSPAHAARHAHRLFLGWTVATVRTWEAETREHPYRAEAPPRKARALVLTQTWRRQVIWLFFVLYGAAFTTFMSASLAFTNVRLTVDRHAASASERASVSLGAGLIALTLAYVAASLLVNVTTITVEPGGTLSVRRGPLPGFATNLTVPVHLVNAIQLVPRSFKGGTTYQIVATLSDGCECRLASGIGNHKHATLLAKLVASRLGHRLPQSKRRAELAA